MFTSEHSLLHRSIPLLPPSPPPPCPPPAPARHLTLPPIPPCLSPCLASHPTWPSTTLPATPPCLPAFPDSLARSSATTASRASQRASAVLVLLQRLCVWGASQRATPSKILRTPSNILRTPSNIIRKSYLWCRGHPIGTALAAGRGELWRRTPLPCEVLEGYIKYFGGLCRILDRIRRILDWVCRILDGTR